MGKLVETTYKAGPDDKLAVVDVYKASDSGIVNSYQDSFGDQDISDYDNAVESSGDDILNGIDTSNSDLLANTPDPEQAVLDQLADEEEDAYFQNKGYNPLSNKTSLSERFGGIGPIYGGDRAALTCSTGMFDKQAQFGKYNPFFLSPTYHILFSQTSHRIFLPVCLGNAVCSIPGGDSTQPCACCAVSDAHVFASRRYLAAAQS